MVEDKIKEVYELMGINGTNRTKKTINGQEFGVKFNGDNNTLKIKNKNKTFEYDLNKLQRCERALKRLEKLSKEYKEAKGSDLSESTESESESEPEDDMNVGPTPTQSTVLGARIPVDKPNSSDSEEEITSELKASVKEKYPNLNIEYEEKSATIAVEGEDDNVTLTCEELTTLKPLSIYSHR